MYLLPVKGLSLSVNSNKGNGTQMPPTSAPSQNWQTSPSNMPNSQPNNNGAPATNGALVLYNTYLQITEIYMYLFSDYNL